MVTQVIWMKIARRAGLVSAIMTLLVLPGMAEPGLPGTAAEAFGATTVPDKAEDAAGSATPVKLVACYFHGTVRCVTCLEIERESRQMVFQSFLEPLSQGLLEWRSVNYDCEPGSAFAKPFNLSVPSLMLIHEGADGKILRWKNLEQMWDYAGNPSRLREYVQAEMLAMLGQVRQPAPPGH